MSVFPLEIWHVIFRHLVPVYPIRPRLQRTQDGSQSIITLHCDQREDPDIAQTLQYFVGKTFRPNKAEECHRAYLVQCLDPAYRSWDRKPLKSKQRADYKRMLANIDREAVEGFFFPGSQAAFRDILDKHAIWQLETNDEPWRYPYSAYHDTPRTEDGIGWHMLNGFTDYVGNRCYIPNVARHILAPISLEDEEKKTGRDLWHAINALMIAQNESEVLKSFDLCIDIKTSEPSAERCHQETAETFQYLFDEKWNHDPELGLLSLVMRMRDFRHSGKCLSVLIRTFVVADQKQPLNDRSTPARVEDVSDGLDGAAE